MKRYNCFAANENSLVDYATDDLNEAIAKCESWRKVGFPHVTMSTCDPNHVGKMGVSDKLPDDYDWVKRRDALSVRRKNI